MNPRVKKVKANENNYTLEIEFENGEMGVFDVSKYLNIGIFKELIDKNKFKKVYVRFGTVVWESEQDLCPDTVYEDSVKEGSV